MGLLNLFLFLLSLLAVFKAPARPLWLAAIVVTEWGHFLAIASLLQMYASWRVRKRWGFPQWLAVIAALLFSTPLVRATVVARQISQGTAPLHWIDLFKGIRPHPVTVITRDYARKDGQPLAMDIYQPPIVTLAESAQPWKLPGIVVVHGGAWQSGDRGEFPELSRYLANQGYVVASIDYRLAPQARFPAPVDDLFSAIAYLKQHATEFSLDPTRLVLLGRSAGGQVVLSAAYAQKDPAIKGVIAFYAPSDLVWGYDHPTNPRVLNSRMMLENYLGGTPSQKPRVYEAASPVYTVSKASPLTLVIHGDRDELVSPVHEDHLTQKLKEAGRPYFYLRLPWATHGCDINFSGPCGQLSTYAIDRFLSTVVPPVTHS